MASRRASGVQDKVPGPVLAMSARHPIALVFIDKFRKTRLEQALQVLVKCGLTVLVHPLLFVLFAHDMSLSQTVSGVARLLGPGLYKLRLSAGSLVA